MEKEPRPSDDAYFEKRLDLLSQGDIFDGVPLAYPSPAREVTGETGSGRRFLSGPLEVGPAMLVTPTCSMRSQSSPQNYAHPVRTLVPLLPLDDRLRARIGIDDAKLGLARKYDGLINYMYVPASDAHGLPECLALLYMPVTLHHEMLAGLRSTQLALEGARQLHRKLVWFASGYLVPRATFTPPLD